MPGERREVPLVAALEELPLQLLSLLLLALEELLLVVLALTSVAAAERPLHGAEQFRRLHEAARARHPAAKETVAARRPGARRAAVSVGHHR